MNRTARRYLDYLASERQAARLYRALAELTDGEPREALTELAGIEEQHAAYWVQKLAEEGVEPPPDSDTPDPDTQSLLDRARRLSIAAVLPDLEAAEREAEGIYDNEPAAPASMSADEHGHAKILAGLRQGQPDPPLRSRTPDEVRSALARAEPWHRNNKSGSMRAGVFGASDGLVSNTALVMGFAGSGVSGGAVLFAGLAGLLAGAFSMAAGEYVSVASQRDIFAREIALEAAELREKPLEEQRELELLYRAKGLDKSLAKQTAEQIMADPDTALDTLVREELGLDPGDLGSPIRAAVASFGAFAVGASVPVVPYIFWSGAPALLAAVVFALIALAVVGGSVGKLSGLGVIRSAIRQVAVGAGAAGVTYFLGQWVGTSLG